MFRKILLIKGFSVNDSELINDRKILELYKKYFASNAGGVYESTEIVALEEPSIETIDRFNDENQFLDSLIILLLGHGGNRDGFQIFWIQKELYIFPGQLNFSSKKQLFIVESCRDIIEFDLLVEDLNGLVPKFKDGGKIERPKTSKASKIKYNDEIDRIENGITYLFASSISESAYEYYFVQYLIIVARHYHEYGRRKIFSIQKIFDESRKVVIQKTKGKQNPILVGDGKFPFVVSII
ncbi:caspase family protein [Cyclobacterium jeungdonense]|uniref:Caspase family protein n=1 Tax=Cyclobacterium jeungdonense TaxID=708087 RepID=A0ABT8C384_9BACT|nr:caspase family protein [Cyclobacterium jeungdonense]MDN3687235.1 caspase family protein [Cyclobacterium jeungdonense]